MFVLKKMGSFMIPGRAVEIANQPIQMLTFNKELQIPIDPNGEYIIENMYVQYFIPEAAKENLILIHGGGQTGAIWESTPDGREGWLQFYLRQGFAVYIVDTVERGRSGWCPLTQYWPESAELRNDNGTWMTFRLGRMEDFLERKPFKNTQFPIEAFDQMLTYNVPRWRNHDDSAASALLKLLKQIGSCQIIAHSQSSSIVMQAIADLPQAVKKLVLLEPSIFPGIKFNANIQTEILMIFGDNIAENKFWCATKELAVDYMKLLQQQAINIQLRELPQVGIQGNSHAIMLDKNNQVVAQYVLDWLAL